MPGRFWDRALSCCVLIMIPPVCALSPFPPFPVLSGRPCRPARARDNAADKEPG